MKIPQPYRPGFVWILAGLALLAISVIGLLGYEIPGIEEFVSWVRMIDGYWILLAAFLAILIEGLYFVGSFFPGSTLIILLCVFAQLQSWTMFTLTIVAIFIGWVVAGMINIFLSARYGVSHSTKPVHVSEVSDRVWLTWYPAFRANQEVAAVVAGEAPRKVLVSSVIVKAWVCVAAAILVAVLPKFYDVTAMENNEGFASILLIALIMLVVGLLQLRTAKAAQNSERPL